MKSNRMIRSRMGLFEKTAMACVAAATIASAHAEITTVFYVLLENRCFTSGTDTSYSNVLFNNKNGGSPYLTSLCTPGSNAYTVNYQGNTISQTAQSSFCSAYHHVFATYDNKNQSPYGANQPAGTSVHPSEPNYVFMEAGSNLSILNDNEPYGSGGSVAAINTFLNAHPTFSRQTLSQLLQDKGISWTSYNEGTCLLNSNGLDYNKNTTSGGTATLTNNVAPVGQRTVPMSSFSGTSANYTNQYNGSHQFNFATKHTGQLFFPATNGGTLTASDTTPTNSMISHYAPLEQLATDMANNTQAQYCVITPDQYNDGHTALANTFTYHNYGGTNSGVDKTYTGGSDLARIAQMDNFCAMIVPQIMSSPVYQAGKAAIVLWTDETEGSPNNDYYHTLTEIVISPQAKGNGYNSTLNYTHSSDLATMQKIFGVVADSDTGYINDAANFSNPTPANAQVIVNNGQGLQTATGQPFFGFGTGTAQDLADLFKPGTIPETLPTFKVTPSGYSFNRKTNTDTQTVTVTNTLGTAITKPVYLLVGNLSSNTSLQNATGTTTNNIAGTPYVLVANSLDAGASATVTLKFNAPSTGTISDTMSVVATSNATP